MRKSKGQSTINLIIDTYDDIFSDFDSRDYSEKAMSIDFLDEIERASRDKTSVELKLFIHKRDNDKEKTIKKRLMRHFKKHFHILKSEIKKIKKKGVQFIVIGTFIMFFASYILFNYHSSSLLASFLIILFEPAGWFFFWEGLDLIIFKPEKIKSKLEFYRKMRNCNIEFFKHNIK